ncbi:MULTISPECIES: 2-C-methyl-D-erythritol 4-phosphate cytidylyltransferase [unclassified Clostridium]|uniref:2-C-methyl-D-erythritol 4-phosphate cytidylyltransferase n=1 Tax=unclassified Clostridium TaxID=2614128 RepID=UPI00189C3899|nr:MULTISPECIES: 2-C-methyl-D-erythritol 4-phosphate cytidylyltransferase [unclassified Clostridium]MBO5130672.1 2-C-methyl-D-erythritol 4-phosphate cytidylyltransferase [Romboutsia sp.]MBP3916475.1 2-C-methyl-D-erythritol 4-phosphate cytidylyltransferase [Clostridium sp.]MEE0932477.1 2-C-methyl-D-erythritol 4-phosphate cytidylyltransferase [Clostridium sp.]
MISAIILAGGKGKRMNSSISKQFIEIKGKPIIYYTIKKFNDNKKIDNIIVVLSQEEIEYFKENILKKYDLKVDKIVVGGAERQDSVYNGLKSLENSETDIVLIHDGARPFISDRIIDEGIKYAAIYGACAPGVMPKDTIKIKDENNFSINTPNRETLVSIQTPQVFKFSEILECHKKVQIDKLVVTDDTMVAEKYGNKVYLYDGEYTNIKVTTPEDLILGEKLI